MNETSNKNGVYNTKFYHDTALIFELNMNKLSFNTSRYINSLIDYNHFITSKSRIVRTEIDTNNLLDTYVSVQNNGIILFDDTLLYNMNFEVRDAYNNTSKLAFTINANEIISDTLINKLNTREGIFFPFSKKNEIKDDSIKVVFPANSFYSSTYFHYNKISKDSNSFSAIYKLGNHTTPVHKYFTIKILPDSILPEINNKIYISYSPDNSDFYYMSDNMSEQYLICKSRELGYYKVMSDTIPPVIKEVNFKNKKNVTKQNTLKIKIDDEQTGIDTYKATLNGEWILMEYDAKKNLLIYNFDKRLIKGINKFKLTVTDMLGNVSEYNCELIQSGI